EIAQTEPMIRFYSNGPDKVERNSSVLHSVERGVGRDVLDVQGLDHLRRRDLPHDLEPDVVRGVEELLGRRQDREPRVLGHFRLERARTPAGEADGEAGGLCGLAGQAPQVVW